MAARRLDRAGGDQARAAIGMPAHRVRLRAAIAERDLAHLVAAALQLPPGEMVRAVLLRADDEVLARTRGDELRRDEAGRRAATPTSAAKSSRDRSAAFPARTKSSPSPSHRPMKPR